MPSLNFIGRPLGRAMRWAGKKLGPQFNAMAGRVDDFLMDNWAAGKISEAAMNRGASFTANMRGWSAGISRGGAAVRRGLSNVPLSTMGYHAGMIGGGGFIGAMAGGEDSRGMGAMGGIAAAYGGAGLIRAGAFSGGKELWSMARGRGLSKMRAAGVVGKAVGSAGGYAAGAGLAGMGLARLTSRGPDGRYGTIRSNTSPVNMGAFNTAPSRNGAGRYATMRSNNGF